MNPADKSNPFLVGWEQTDDAIIDTSNIINEIEEGGGDTKVIGEAAFDPFETIIDDDSSLSSSPGLQHNAASNVQNEPTNEIKMPDDLTTTAMTNKSTNNFNNNNNNINNSDNDDKIGSIYHNYDDESGELQRQLSNKQFDGDDHYHEEELNADDRDESLRKSLRIDLDQDYDGDNNVGKDVQPVTSVTAACEMEKYSATDYHDEHQCIEGDENGELVRDNLRISFFDPFETVIDKDALNTPMNAKYFEDELTIESAIETSNDNSVTNFDDSHRQDNVQTNDVVLEELRHGVPEEAAEPIAKNELAEEISKEQQQQTSDNNTTEPEIKERIEVTMKQAAITSTPAKNRTPRHRRKPSFQEDSSDEDDEDDRIQIVIRAKDTGDITRSHGASFVPLLPPPPSKSSMKQARERGQVEDMPSPIITHCRKSAAASAAAAASGVNHTGELADNINASRFDKAETAGKLADRRMSDQDDFDDEAVHNIRGEDHDDGNDQEHYDDNDNDDEADDHGKHGDDGAFVIGGAGEGTDTPLYDDDTSYVLEDFPPKFTEAGWNMMLRYPPKKKLTSNRFWKRIFVKIARTTQDNSVVLQIYENVQDKPVQEIRLQPTYTISEISTQQYDQFGKIFTLKIQYIFYRERVGVRPGQLARLVHSGHIGTSTTSGGHGVGPTSIGDLKRYGAPLEHVPQVSQIIKLGCQSYSDIKQLKCCLEDELFKMPIARDKAMSVYKTEEIQMAVRDEIYIECNQVGTITKQLARVRLFFLSFMNGMPVIEVGINDIYRQGKEIVGRLDILPVVTEEWIRIEASELHCTVDQDEFEKPDSRMIKLSPPDGVFFELMRFRVRPPRNRELPLQVSASMCVTRTKVTINCDVIVPGCTSRKHGQIPCEDIAIRIYVPECWIYFFRTEKHFRYGSVKSTNKRAGKVKGIERFLGGGDTGESNSLIEVTSGQAKYEHHYNAIVWRAARWPKENQSAYVQNSLKIKMPLTIYDKMPDTFNEYIYVEYSMPATTVSHTTLRSISVNPCDDEPPEKYVKYSANYEYKVKMRLSINLNSNKSDNALIEEKSPIIIMKQPDAPQDLIRQEDSNDDDDSDFSEEKENDNSAAHRQQQQRHHMSDSPGQQARDSDYAT